MQDIDFDEIDRAVSSVTNQKTRGSSVPEVARSAPVVTSAPEPVAVDPSPAMRRSSGRFMDVVHPSSDMRPSSLSRSVPARDETSRIAVPPRVEPVTTEEPSTSTESGFHWPEPTIASTPDPTASTPDAPAPLSESDVTDDMSPLESPFLSGTKIEKRPLGAFSTTEPETELPLIDDFPAPIQTTPPETSQTEAVPDPEIKSVKEDIPRELHEDVLMLEAHREVEEEPATVSSAEQVKDTPTVIEQSVPTTPTSITQQYKEQPSASVTTSGSIYDTEAYHQPLKHTVKKHSSALVVIWIATLILVGGGIGLAIYYVFLPTLG